MPEILETRKGMWDAVASRKHTVHKIFPFGNNATEFMLFGEVDLGMRTGGSRTLDWSARAQVEISSINGKCQMRFYQVYLVCLSTSRAFYLR